MFQFSEPSDIKEADPYYHQDIHYDLYWKSAGLSANSYWIVNSSCNEWIGFKSEIVPVVYPDPENINHWNYDRENEYEEMIWIRKSEMPAFLSAAALSERANAIVRTNRFTFVMDSAYGDKCQLIRENKTGFEIHMADRGDFITLLALVATWDWEYADEITDKSIRGDYRKNSIYHSMSGEPIVFGMDGKIGDHVFCLKCNTIQEGWEAEYTIVNGACYDCKEKEKS